MFDMVNPRKWWLLGFAAINAFAGVYMSVTGELIGFGPGNVIPSKSVVLEVTVATVVALILVLGVLFDFLSLRLRPKSAFNRGVALAKHEVPVRRPDPSVLGHVIIALQLCGIAIGIWFGYKIAGRADDLTFHPLKSLWLYLVPIDALFLLYFSIFRSDRLAHLNLVVWLGWGFIRGWTGGFVAIAFLESCRLLREKPAKAKWLLACSLLAFALIGPVLQVTKASIRASDGNAGISEIASVVIAEIDGIEFWWAAVFQTVERLQTVSTTVEVARQASLFQSEYRSNKILPFYYEGPHAVILRHIVPDVRGVLPVGVAFTDITDTKFGFESITGNWNANIGFVGWLIIAPSSTPLYLLYMICLCAMSCRLVLSVANTESARDVLWYSWGFYLMAPWQSVFIQFLYAVLLLKLLIHISNKKVRRKSLTFPRTSDHIV